MPQDHARTPANPQAFQAAKTTPTTKRTREVVVDCVNQFEQRRAEGVSQRQVAQQLGVPRTSLQHWTARKDGLDADPALINFFESSSGVAFLHRLVTGAHVVFSFLGAAGIRLIGRFLREIGLGPFVATSVGSQGKVAKQVEHAIGAYGEEQKVALSRAMSPKTVTVCEDETFHPKPCLVAIEPVSNFILLERYDSKRDAATWNQRLSEALDGLPVKVVQSTSDEAKGILAHARGEFDAHHSPDVFHVQHTLGGVLARPLAKAVRRADQALKTAQATCADVDAQRAAWEAAPRGPGRAPDFDGRHRLAQARVEGAQKKRDLAQQRQERGRQAIRGMGRDYHPVDLRTGKLRTPQQVKEALEGHINSARDLVEQEAVPDKATRGIDKAARVVPAMAATLIFFLLGGERHGGAAAG